MVEPYDEELLLGYIEGELTDEQAADVEAMMQQDARLAQLIKEIRADRDAVRDLPQPITPDWLMEEVDRLLERSMLLDATPADQIAVRGQQRHVLRRIGMIGAIAAMVAVVASVLVNSLYAPRPTEPTEYAVADAEPADELAEESTDLAPTGGVAGHGVVMAEPEAPRAPVASKVDADEVSDKVLGDATMAFADKAGEALEGAEMLRGPGPAKDALATDGAFATELPLASRAGPDRYDDVAADEVQGRVVVGDAVERSTRRANELGAVVMGKAAQRAEADAPTSYVDASKPTGPTNGRYEFRRSKTGLAVAAKSAGPDAKEQQQWRRIDPEALASAPPGSVVLLVLSNQPMRTQRQLETLVEPVDAPAAMRPAESVALAPQKKELAEHLLAESEVWDREKSETDEVAVLPGADTAEDAMGFLLADRLAEGRAADAERKGRSGLLAGQRMVQFGQAGQEVAGFKVRAAEEYQADAAPRSQVIRVRVSVTRVNAVMEALRADVSNNKLVELRQLPAPVRQYGQYRGVATWPGVKADYSAVLREQVALPAGMPGESGEQLIEVPVVIQQVPVEARYGGRAEREADAQPQTQPAAESQQVEPAPDEPQE